MRIGELTKDNYMNYMKMFGGKDIKLLDNMWGKDKAENAELTEEEVIAKRVKSGRAEEGMYIGGSDKSWQKIVPVSKEVEDKIIKSVRKWFMANGNEMSDAQGRDGDELGTIMKAYCKNIPPSERLAVTYTLGEIAYHETCRMLDYVRFKDASWNYGKKFDPSIFDDYVSGGIDIKV